MNLQARLESLQTKHAELDERIHEFEIAPYENIQQIKSLKLEKLHIKEEIEQLQQTG